MVKGIHSTGGTRRTLYHKGSRSTLYWRYKAFTLLVVQDVHSTGGTLQYTLQVPQGIHFTDGTRSTLYWRYKEFTLLVVQGVHSTMEVQGVHSSGGARRTLYWW